MKKLKSFLLLLLCLGSLSAQTFVGKLNYHPENFPKLLSSSDTIKILAVMVEFKKYKDPNASGDGTFGSIYTQAYGDTILDPLPFDAKYFSSHLDFAKNYFAKVSNGKLNVAYTILPQVITVSDTMRKYSPIPQNASDQTNLGKFAKEVWQIASTTYPDLDFSKYNLFTVFHAGVGREFSVPGSIGNERDIPSVYLGLNSLKNIFGSSFKGFSVNGGNFFINNTMILPSTESREVSSVSGNELVQLTINGLIVSSIASHLGLPDLFNTSTGTTAISRFGLMDGSSIFAYSGIFPPEPCAWEKIYLGWATPVTLSIADARINIAARRTAAINDTTILKVPINSTEYYLIENRQRDANKDGLKLTYNLHGQSYTFSLDKDKGRFQWYGVDTVKGVVTDVDDFDWAAPGNGIVIWHVDENIIGNTIANDRINADPDHRGLYVEEADGIFDIGVKYQSITGDVGYGDGYQEDMWYAGNTGKYFKNKFGPDTKPNTNSNSGANSLITMQNFSAPANKMGFNISFGGSDVKLVTRAKLNLDFPGEHKSLIALFGFNKPNYFLVDGNDLKRFNSNGSLESDFKNFTYNVPAGLTFKGVQYIVGATGKTLNVYSKNVSSEEFYNSNNDLMKSVSLPFEIISPITIKEKEEQLFIYACTSEGHLLEVGVNTLLTLSTLDQSYFEKYPNIPAGVIAVSSGTTPDYIAGLSNEGFNDSQLHHISLTEFPFFKDVLTEDNDGNFVNITASTPRNSVLFRVIKNGNVLTSFELPSSKNILDYSVADLFSDGQNYIIIQDGNYLKAYNYSGGVADNFPFTEPNGDEFLGAPLAVDFNNDGITEIIAYTKHGSIYAINPKTGKVVDGFPLSTGAYPMASPVLYSEKIDGSGIIKPYLVWLDYSSTLYVWSLSQSQGKTYWAGQYGDAGNTSFVQAPTSTNQVTEYFPTDRAYNYPNPVYGGETQIRYYVSENSDVQIKIFDLAGGLVADLTDHAAGGFDHETNWNVNKVQSGVYYAHVQVNGESGKSASKIIKIAVIK
jgi:hypothetical protein